MSTGVTCSVYLAGERIADGSPTDDPLAPTVLSGLSFAWGRNSIVDQPDASTCSFELLDEAGGQSFLTLLRTGMPIDVFATGTTFPDPDTSIVLDPGFEQTPIGAQPGNVRSSNASATVQAAPGGGRALRLIPPNPLSAAIAEIAPAPFSATPGDWDEIPATAGGQTWTVRVRVFAPRYSTVQLQPLLFADQTGDRVQTIGAPVSAAGTDGYQTLTVTVTPGVIGSWMGMRVRSWPTGARWTQWLGTWAAAPGTWRDRVTTYIDDVEILAPEEGLARTVLAFSGRVTDVAAGYDDARDVPIVAVTAVDFTADLDNLRIGDLPWPEERFADRFLRVLDMTGLGIEAHLDPALTDYQLSYQDVDSQPATGLLKDFAQSVDGVMWSATHQTTGPYVRVEDTTARPPLFLLYENDAGLVVTGPATEDGTQISACDVLRDPVQWLQSVSDISTRVAVTWLEQGVDDEGRPATTERTETVISTELEQLYGQRGISVSTLLSRLDDAHAVALRILSRTSVDGWRVTGLTVDDDSIESADSAIVTTVLQLLDGTSRNGLPIVLTDLPEWSPSDDVLPVYLEGGTYTYEDGAWVLELTVSRAEGQGQSVPWEDLDLDWAWIDFDLGLTWDGLIGTTTTPQGAVTP